MSINDLDINSKVTKEFTVNSFLSNPTGNQGSMARMRVLALEDLRKKFNSLVTLRGDFKYNFYQINGKKDIFLRVKVPSESFDNFTYDVVIKFINPDLNSPNISLSNIQFFSNSPSFTYFYAFTFNFFSLLIPELEKKVNKKALDQFPKDRNPDAVVFYEKSITFALLFIKEKQLMDMTQIKSSTITTVTKDSFFKGICVSTEVKEIEYKKLKDKETQKKKLERQKRKEDSKGLTVKEAPISTKNESKTINKTIDTKISNKINMQIKDKKVDNKVNMKIKP